MLCKELLPFQFPLSGLNLDLDPALLKGKVKDLIIYLHHRLKRVGFKTKKIVIEFSLIFMLIVFTDIITCYSFAKLRP